jgi:hypothetical protein
MRMEHKIRGERKWQTKKKHMEKRRKMIEKKDWLMDQAVYKFVWADRR